MAFFSGHDLRLSQPRFGQLVVVGPHVTGVDEMSCQLDNCKEMKNSTFSAKKKSRMHA
jgi:hypothetical protein